MLRSCAVYVNVSSADLQSVTAHSAFRLRITFPTDYIGISRPTMADVYRMTIHGSESIINHYSGGTVGVYKTEICHPSSWRVIARGSGHNVHHQRLDVVVAEMNRLTRQSGPGFYDYRD